MTRSLIFLFFTVTAIFAVYTEETLMDELVKELEPYLKGSDLRQNLDSNLSDFHIDELALVEIVIAVDKHFGIDIPDDEANQVKTFRDLKDLVVKYLKEDGQMQ